MATEQEGLIARRLFLQSSMQGTTEDGDHHGRPQRLFSEEISKGVGCREINEHHWTATITFLTKACCREPCVSVPESSSIGAGCELLTSHT